jgi:hypothetical protein
MAADQVWRRFGNVADQITEVYCDGEGQGNDVRPSAGIFQLDFEPALFCEGRSPNYRFGIKPRLDAARHRLFLRFAFPKGSPTARIAVSSRSLVAGS